MNFNADNLRVNDKSRYDKLIALAGSEQKTQDMIAQVYGEDSDYFQQYTNDANIRQEVDARFSSIARNFVYEAGASNGHHLCNAFNKGAGVEEGARNRIDMNRRAIARTRLEEAYEFTDAIPDLQTKKTAAALTQGIEWNLDTLDL